MPELSIEFLRSVPLFSDLRARDLLGVARWLTRREVAAGESLTHEGTGGIGFFIIESGSADVWIDGCKVRTLEERDHFGEIALLAESMRSATITSDAGMVCWGMRAWIFTPLVRSQPSVAEKLLEGMARQLAY